MVSEYKRRLPPRGTTSQCPICTTPSSPLWDDSGHNSWYLCSNCTHRWCSVTNADTLSFHKTNDRFNYRSPAAAKLIAEKRMEVLSPYLTSISSSIDIGSGCGAMSMALPSSISRTGIDPNNTSPLGLVNGVVFRRGSIWDVPSMGTFDLVLCYHVIEHITNIWDADKIVFGAAKRVVAVEIPNSRKLRLYDGHVQEFSGHSLRMFLEKPRDGWDILYTGSGVQAPARVCVWGKHNV